MKEKCQRELLPLWNLLQWLRSPVGSTRDLWLWYLSFCTAFSKVAKISGNFLFLVPSTVVNFDNLQNRNVNMNPWWWSPALCIIFFKSFFRPYSPGYKLRSNLRHFHTTSHISHTSSLLNLSLIHTWREVQVSSEGKNEGITDCTEHLGDVYHGGGLSGSDLQSSATELLCECNYICSSTF